MKPGVRKPYKIDQKLSAKFRATIEKARIAVPEGWTIFVTDTKCGRCYYSKRCVTVPKWAMTRDARGVADSLYKLYYVAHEIAHAITDPKEPPHGAVFMENFKMLCPQELWHYELNYKPRNAAAAGIRSEV